MVNMLIFLFSIFTMLLRFFTNAEEQEQPVLFLSDTNGTMNFYHVSNLSNIDVSSFFLPFPFSSKTTTPKPDIDHNKKNKPDSPIGYEVPCGIRGVDVERNEDLRIVGGSNAGIGEFPWQISLQLVSGWTARHICGGAIIGRHWVVTAAHCVDGIPPSSLSVVAGDHNLYKVEGTEQRVAVIRIVSKGYRKGNFTNDIALLQVEPLKYGKWVAPLCVPKPYHSFPTKFGTVAGWGRLSENGDLPEVLQRVTLPLVTKSKCAHLYIDAGYGHFLNKCQLCSGYDDGGYDSCQGDSGGPLVCERKDGFYYLCGVVSWGVGCARPRLPGVYTEVTCYSNWIRDIIYSTTTQQISSLSDLE